MPTLNDIAIGGWFPLVGVFSSKRGCILPPKEEDTYIPKPIIFYLNEGFRNGGPALVENDPGAIATHITYIAAERGSIALTAQAEGYTYTVGLTFNTRRNADTRQCLDIIGEQGGGAVFLLRPYNDGQLHFHQVFHPLKPPQTSWAPAPESDSTPSDLLQVSLQGVDIAPYHLRSNSITATQAWEIWQRERNSHYY